MGTIRMSSKKQKSEEWKLVTSYSVETYHCGLKAGDMVKLKSDLEITCEGKLVRVHKAGQIWKVLHGAVDDPGTIWFLRPDGERHTWTDDQSVFEYLERVE